MQKRFAFCILHFAFVAPLLAQTPHDISTVDRAPAGGAISVPLPESERKRLEKYDIPDLAGAQQALGSQLIKGELPKPILDYIANEGPVIERLSMFEGGLVVINVSGAAGTIRKKLLIPADAMKNYLKAVNAEMLAKIPDYSLQKPQQGREARLRVYTTAGKFVERSFDPMAVMPKSMNDQLLPLQDLLRAMYEDRGVTSSVAGYMPKTGDRLVADDQKIYRVMRVIDDRLVELHCETQPMTIYVATADLHKYFIGTAGAARQ